MVPCRVPECAGDKTRVIRGLCHKHYARLLRHGSPTGGRDKPRSGTIYLKRNGYTARTVAGRWQMEHIRVAEAALGRPLPKGAQVHHVNENKQDNRGENLVICPSAAYHALLHRRAAALDACGHADWRTCAHCHKYDDPKNLHISTTTIYHRSCRSAYNVSRSAAHGH